MREARSWYGVARVDSSDPKDEILTLKELAVYLSINPRTVHWLLTDRRLPTFRIDHAWRFRKSQVDEWTRSSGGIHGGGTNHG